MNATPQEHTQDRYASVNGLNLYYEIHGAGKPLVLLPGAFQTIDALGALLPALAESRRVIAVELQGHGHTADIDRPLSHELMADDIAALITYLGLENADLFGYSRGGGVALQTAIRHPDVVRKLVVTSAPCKRDGWYPEVLAGMAAITAEVAGTWVGSPMHDAYVRVAPRPEDWPTVADKMGRMLRQEYDWSPGVAALEMPTLIVVGDADGVRPAHVVEMFQLLGGGKADVGMGDPPASQLAVLPGTTHFTILARTDLLLPIITPFLDAPMPERK
ncbi:MAG: alpha/beta fold hydrolase [Thermomicrobiales bacterium]